MKSFGAMSRSKANMSNGVGRGRFRLLVAACYLMAGAVAQTKKDGSLSGSMSGFEIANNQATTDEFGEAFDDFEAADEGIEGVNLGTGAAASVREVGRDGVLEADDLITTSPVATADGSESSLLFGGPPSSSSGTGEAGTATAGSRQDATAGYIVILKQPALAALATGGNKGGGGPGREDLDILLNQANLDFEDFDDFDGPKEGKKTNFNTPYMEGYATILKNEQMDLVKSIGMKVEDVTNSFVTAVNGFSIEMTKDQAQAIEKMEEVAVVHEDYQLEPTTDTTQQFLGITGTRSPDGSSCRRTPYDGKGTVVGIIDTGIWPEHESFKDNGNLPQAPALSWQRTATEFRTPCDFGNRTHNPDDTPFRCNNKLIGGRTYLNSFQKYYSLSREQFNSCRDDDGHGTHTASTAAGNADVPVSYPGYPTDTKVSGVAPMAHVIAYKVCSSYVSGGQVRGTCFLSDSAAAIDQAMRDGVDVINYSIGGGARALTVTEMLWLECERMGIFVATSAGNSGRSGKNTVGSPASVPWITTVGASSEPTTFQAMVSYGDESAVGPSAFDHEEARVRRRNLKSKSPKKGQAAKQQQTVEAGDQKSDGQLQTGGGLREPEGRTPLGNPVLQPKVGDSGGSLSDPSSGLTTASSCQAKSSSAGVAAPPPYVTNTCLIDAADAGSELCLAGKLDRTKVNGCIVLCMRGEAARVAKSTEVNRTGGVGMIFYNAPDGFTSQYADLHAVQTVHLTYDQGKLIKQYISQTTNPRATLSVDFIGNSTGPMIADFSSRGMGYYKHQLKPDITAPGVSILAGHTPRPFRSQRQGMQYQVISGTSMSSPHITGIFALIKEAHPDWSASKARSAIMTTAHQEVYVNADKEMARPCDMGSGHLDLDNRWLNPGLVYPTEYRGYLAFICNQYPSRFNGNCREVFQTINVPLEPWNLNYPSIVAAEFAGIRTLVRTVERVDTDMTLVKTYTATIDPPPGYNVVVDPPKLQLEAGESRDFTVTVTRLPATDSTPYGEFSFGSLTWIDDDRNYSVRSPIAANSMAIHVPRFLDHKPDDADCTTYPVTFGFDGTFEVTPFLQPGKKIPGFVGHKKLSPRGFAVQGTNRFLRLRMRSDEDEDLDIYLFNPDGMLVKSSRYARTNEVINIWDPMEGIWIVIVEGYDTNQVVVPYDLYTWTIPAVSSRTHLTANPAGEQRVRIGDTKPIQLCFRNLEAGEWYWGFVLYETDQDVDLPLTVVQADNR